MKEEIERAVEVLHRGGIILYPTDTVWGIGCDATDETAVERVYQLKRSCNKKGMIVLTESIDRVGCYFRNIPAVAWDLLECADKPLTLIPKGFGDIAEEIRAGVDYTVDIRCEGAPTRKASSIIMLGEDGEVKIIRE